MGHDLRAVTIHYTVPDTNHLRQHFPEYQGDRDELGDDFAEAVIAAAEELAQRVEFRPVEVV